MKDLVSVVEPIGNGAESPIQQLFFPLYAHLPYLKSMIMTHMVFYTASNNKANT
jgi:hypothetical protein